MAAPKTSPDIAPVATPRAPSAPRWLKVAGVTLAGTLGVAVVAVGGLWIWAGTDGSLATALRLAGKSQPLQTAGVRGSLRAGGHIDRLQWQQDGLAVDARDIDLAWQPWALLHGTLQLDRLAIASVQVQDQRPPSTTPSTPPTALGLPLPVTLDAFSVGQFGLAGATAFSASDIAGRYTFNSLQHQLDVVSVQVASGRYNGRAVLGTLGAPTLDATLAGAVSTAVPGAAAPVDLAFTARAQGLLTDLRVKADLSVATPTSPSSPAKATAASPQASATARVMPWAAQPLPEADARFSDLDVGALWPEAPQTRLTGSASIRPSDAAVKLADAAWRLKLQMTNQLPGPWDEQRLPLAQLDTEAEWHAAGGGAPASAGTALIRSFKAQLGGGEIVASGEWASAPPAPVASAPASGASTPAPPPGALAAAAQAWQVQATVAHVNPTLLHTQLAPLPIDGRATVRGEGAATAFEVNLQAAGAGTPLPRKAQNNSPLGALRLRDASATGRWNPQAAGGTLTLSALRVRTDDAELKGQLDVQPAARSGKGQLNLTAPGLDAQVQGELRPASGAGELSVRGRDAAQALRWIQKLPGLQAPGSALQTASASGNASLVARWQGGWQDPTLQATLDVPTLDWRMPPAVPRAVPVRTASTGAKATTAAAAGASATTPASTPTAAAGKGRSPTASAASATTVAAAPATPATATVSATAGSAATPATPITPASSTPPAAPTVIQVRALQVTLAGKLSQAQLNAQGRVEMDQRRYALQLAADGGRAGSASTSPWQGLVRQLSLSVEDPALGASAWRLATRNNVALKWTPGATGSAFAFESGAGEAVLTAPAPPARQAGAANAALPNPVPTQALLSWQPVRWRPGEFVTAGKLSGLPLAWVELFAGPQLAGAGLTGNLVFDGEWDARLADTLSLKASLSRSAGDLTVQAETTQGAATRVAAGVKQASLSLANQGDALTLALRWDSERAGTVDARVATRLSRAPAGEGVGGWLWPADAPLNGQVRAQLPRIGVWSVLAPPGWRLRGSLGADVAISGTRSAPLLTGDLSANDLALRSVVDGIEFANGRLRARLDGTRLRISEFTLQGAGDKGTGGLLTAQGDAGWVDGQAQVQLTARLDRLRASIRTDRQLTVSGNVQASLQGPQTTLGGQLLIDQARIILPDEGTPQLGDDVVVRTARGAAAGQKAPQQTSAAGEEKARPLKLGVQIDLGRDFRIQGKGIDTRVRGTLALSGDSLREPRLTGTVNTDGGQYRAYGQRLDVEQGLIRFTGAIDNPVLDILAIRPNLTQRVGVQITGTALLPRVRLYAQPDLPDAEKLSWLVVGRASASGGAEAALLQQAALALLGSKGGGMSGGLAASLGLDELSFRGAASNADGTTTEGAITLGKRFSRNFYAAYERSISGALGTLYIFYDLSQRFTVRAQAGEQSAIDLIFTVPYD